MAKLSNIKMYESIKAGKRLVSVPTADLRALYVWLWRNGYAWKTNKNGNAANVMISEK